jgi:hypothetical protein
MEESGLPDQPPGQDAGDEDPCNDFKYYIDNEYFGAVEAGETGKHHESFVSM